MKYIVIKTHKYKISNSLSAAEKFIASVCISFFVCQLINKLDLLLEEIKGEIALKKRSEAHKVGYTDCCQRTDV